MPGWCASVPGRSSSSRVSRPFLPFLLEEPFELIHSFAPEALVPVTAPGTRRQGLGRQGNQPLPPLFLARDQAGTLQELEMLRDGVEGQLKRPGDIGEARRTGREPADDRPPGRVRNSR